MPGIESLWDRVLDELAWRGRRQGRTGPVGERLAARYLARHGWRIRGRNVRLTPGELDLICEPADQSAWVLVEVKSRRIGSGDRPPGRGTSGDVEGEVCTGPDWTAPEHRVGGAKRRKLIQLARAMQQDRRWANRPIRIDVVGVDIPPGGQTPVIRHTVNAVRP